MHAPDTRSDSLIGSVVYHLVQTVIRCLIVFFDGAGDVRSTALLPKNNSLVTGISERSGFGSMVSALLGAEPGIVRLKAAVLLKNMRSKLALERGGFRHEKWMRSFRMI